MALETPVATEIQGISTDAVDLHAHRAVSLRAIIRTAATS
jgi:hypothetical protein